MSALALPDPTREPIPAGWSEALLERLTEVEDVSTLDSSRATIAGYIAAYRAKGADTRELQRGERFVEVRIGELLGPPPGHGPGAGKITGQSPFPPERAYEFRQLAACCCGAATAGGPADGRARRVAAAGPAAGWPGRAHALPGRRGRRLLMAGHVTGPFTAPLAVGVLAAGRVGARLQWGVDD